MRPAVITFAATLILGPVAGFVLRISPKPGMCILLGAGLALPFAYAAGLLVLLVRPGWSKLEAELRGFVLFGALLTTVVGLVAWLDDLPGERAKFTRAERLRNLEPGDIRQLRVYDLRGGRERFLEDPVVIREFVRAVRDARGSAGHGGRADWVVEVIGARSFLLTVQDFLTADPAVRGRFISGTWNPEKCHVQNLGAFTCPGLKAWFLRWVVAGGTAAAPPR